MMNARALQANAPFMSKCAGRLERVLGRHADAGAPLDLMPALNDLTLTINAWIACSVDLGSDDAMDAQPVVTVDPRVDLADGWWSAYPVGSPEFTARLKYCSIAVGQALDARKMPLWDGLVS